jgi:hypothetical protein
LRPSAHILRPPTVSELRSASKIDPIELAV